MKFTYRSIGATLAAVCLVFSSGCLPGKDKPVPGETRTFDGIEFQWCPPGTFIMGSPESEEGHESNETQHQVTISKGFWLGKYEVTQAQWKAVMGSNPSYFKKNGKPVESVSWDSVQDYIAALNAGKGVGGAYRLPTESEWEYACRAGTTTRFYWGEDSGETTINDYAWIYENSSSKTHISGKKTPNAWGLYDMSGNVWEWCQDWYGDYPAGPVTDPLGPTSGNLRTLRGGSWSNHPTFCRAAERSTASPVVRYLDLGFRLLRTQD